MLPEFILDAVKEGKIQIKRDKQGEYLVGETTYPNSTVILSFSGHGPKVPHIPQHLFMLKEIAQLKAYPPDGWVPECYKVSSKLT